MKIDPCSLGQLRAPGEGSLFPHRLGQDVLIAAGVMTVN